VSDYIDLAALAQVLLVSLIGGVGLVALYALGPRYLALGRDDGRRGAVPFAVLCFVVVVIGVLTGLLALLRA
jgi:hypothetical protein